MNKLKLWITKWKYDHNLKAIISAFGSLAVTMAFAAYNGFLGIYCSSLWHGTICVYYIVLSILRGMIIKRLRSQQKASRKKEYITASVLLLTLNLCLIAPICIMVVQQKPVHMTLIPAITMAAYTTYKVTMASVHLKRRRRSGNGLIRLLRTISFIDALVSILTLQNTLIMVSTKETMPEMLALTAITSGAVWIVILLLSVSAFISSIRDPETNQ